MYARRSGERELTFDFGAGLLQDNLILVDRETDSVWSQLEGRAISGPLRGEPLRTIPAIQTTWGHWRSLHPDTRAMVVEGVAGWPYTYRSRVPGTQRPRKRAKKHDASALGLGLAAAGESIFFPFRELGELDAARFPLATELGGRAIRVHYRADAPSAWAESTDGRLLPGVLAYEWGWKRFHPESRIFKAD